jgi:hypothetical protein
MPFTLRLAFHVFRAAMLALTLTIAAWVMILPATPAERGALGAQIGTQRPDGLIQMRVAQAIVHFAPNRAARMISRSSNGEISEELAGMLLRDLAKGAAANAPIIQNTVTATPSTRGGDTSAKFVQVD